MRHPKQMKIAALVLALFAGGATSAQASTWLGGSGSWDDASKWGAECCYGTSGQPQTGDSVFVPTFSTDITIDYANSLYPDVKLFKLDLGVYNGQTGAVTLNVTKDKLSVSSNVISTGSNTHLVQTGGTIEGNVYLAYPYDTYAGDPINSSFTLQGGTFIGSVSVDPSSTFIYSGGTATFTGLNVRGGQRQSLPSLSFYPWTVTNHNAVLSVMDGTETAYFSASGSLGSIPVGYNQWIENSTPGKGIVNGRIVVNGSASISSYTQLNQGLLSRGTSSISGSNVETHGALTNEGRMTLDYLTLIGTGGLQNFGSITQRGDGQVDTTTLSTTGLNANFGNFDLNSGGRLQLNGANFSNAGAFNLNGGFISGTGTFDNALGGLVYGRGVISAPFSNSGGTLAVTAGNTAVFSAFANAGSIQLGSVTASLTGGQISNTGTIEGIGSVGNAIVNQGSIEGRNGTLTLGGTLTNTAGGTLSAAAGGKLLVLGAFGNNQGVISVTGGTFDTDTRTLANNGQISGYGTFRTSGLTNNSQMVLAGGTATVNGAVTNNGMLEISHAPAIFTGSVVNNGVFKTTGATVTFVSSYTENGLYFSDPSTNIFTDLIVGTNGYLVGGTGDQFFVSNDFINGSTRNTDWHTDLATLRFIAGADAVHTFKLAGSDLGALDSGYNNNFAWSSLELSLNQQLYLQDGNAVAGGALYVGALTGAVVNVGTISNIHGNGFNVYYDSDNAANAYLGGQTFALADGGVLAAAAPVPEPETYALMLAGLGLVGAMVRRRQQAKA